VKYSCSYLSDLFNCALNGLSSALGLIFRVVFKEIEMKCLLCGMASLAPLYQKNLAFTKHFLMNEGLL